MKDIEISVIKCLLKKNRTVTEEELRAGRIRYQEILKKRSGKC